MLKKSLLVLILFVFLGCQQKGQEWNPIFEDTNFDYFKTNIERSLALIDDAYTELKFDKEASIQEQLLKAKNRLIELKDYYVPLTTIRQKIYDAERYFKLNDIKKSAKLLKNSKSIIESLEVKTQNKVFDKVMLDLNSMINEVIISLDENSKRDTYNRMKTLGEHLNLMLYRGDLILSGIELEK